MFNPGCTITPMFKKMPQNLQVLLWFPKFFVRNKFSCFFLQVQPQKHEPTAHFELHTKSIVGSCFLVTPCRCKEQLIMSLCDVIICLSSWLSVAGSPLPPLPSPMALVLNSYTPCPGNLQTWPPPMIKYGQSPWGDHKISTDRHMTSKAWHNATEHSSFEYA